MEWIKCSDRLPKENERVLICWNDENYFEFAWIKNSKFHLFYDGEKIDIEFRGQPDYWMPLPEKPIE